MPGEAPIRYAVVGLGWIAQAAVLPAFGNARRNSVLSALVSGDASKRRSLSDRYGVSRTVGYDGYEDLVASGEVDAVYIATPNHLHREYAVKAAEAGVHVLCEKPMAGSSEDCLAMMRAAEANRVRLMIAYRLHFEGANLSAAERVRSGRVGEPRLFASLNTQQVEPGDVRLGKPQEEGGGPLFDIGIYCINAARYLFAAEPVQAHAVLASPSGDGRFDQVPETVSCTLRFPGERLAHFATSFGTAQVSAFHVLGTDGSLELEQAYGFRGEKHLEVRPAEGDVERERFEDRDHFGPQLLYFSDCILEGRKPEPSGEEGLLDVRIIEALQQSAREGAPVQLDLETRDRRPDPSMEIRCPQFEEPAFVHASDPTE